MNIFLFFLIFGVIFLVYKKIKSKNPKNLKLDKFKNKLQSTQTNIERIFLREEEKTFSNPNINIYIGFYDNEDNINRKSNMIPKTVKNWIIESKKLFSLFLISNNPSKKRIAKIAIELNLRYKYNAAKPRKKVTLSAINEIGREPKNIAIIGDRIFTDIIVGNRCDIKTLLVKRLNRDGLPIKFNLTLTIEKLISHFIK